MDNSRVDVTVTALDAGARGAQVAIAYDDQRRAADVLTAMKRLDKDGTLHLNDAVAVAKTEDGMRRVKVDWDVTRTVAGTAAGLVIGALVGLVFLSPVTAVPPFLWPVIGALFGAAAGGWAGTFADAEHIDDDMLEIRSAMPPGSSALLMLVEEDDPDTTIAALRPYGGTVLRTTLPEDAEARLRAALSQAVLGAAQSPQRG